MRSPTFHHPRLLNEATMLGTEAILHQMPVGYSSELEQAVQQAVHQAVRHYADGLATRERQLRPLDSAKVRA
jgi:hypothetical protein